MKYGVKTFYNQTYRVFTVTFFVLRIKEDGEETSCRFRLEKFAAPKSYRPLERVCKRKQKIAVCVVPSRTDRTVKEL
jgi:hypothetical protein